MIVSAFDAKLARQMQPGEFFAFQGHPGLRLVATERNRTWTYRYSSPATARQRQDGLGHWPALSFALAVDAWGESPQRAQQGNRCCFASESRKGRLNGQTPSERPDARNRAVAESSSSIWPNL